MRLLFAACLTCFALAAQVTPSAPSQQLPSFTAGPQSPSTKNTCDLPAPRQRQFAPFDFCASPLQTTKIAPKVEIAGGVGIPPTVQNVNPRPECSIPLLKVAGVETHDSMIIAVPPADPSVVVQPPAPPCDRNP